MKIPKEYRTDNSGLTMNQMLNLPQMRKEMVIALEKRKKTSRLIPLCRPCISNKKCGIFRVEGIHEGMRITCMDKEIKGHHKPKNVWQYKWEE